MNDKKIVKGALGVVIASLLMCVFGVWRIHENREDCLSETTLINKLSDEELAAKQVYDNDLTALNEEQFQQKYNSMKYERQQGNWASQECSNQLGKK
jgi:hypothetical protein